MKEYKEVLNALEEIEKDLKTISNDVKILESIAEQDSSACIC